jgi:plasmid stability protein
MLDVQALPAYYEGMQYTLRNIPSNLDKALRQRARLEGRSLNDVAVEALMRGAGVSEEAVRHRDLDGIAGTWIDDPAFDEAMRDQDRIDEDLWK